MAIIKVDYGEISGGVLKFDETQSLTKWKSTGTQTLSDLKVGDIICLWGCALKAEIDRNSVVLTGLELLSYPPEATDTSNTPPTFLKVTASNPTIQKTISWSTSYISVCKLIN